DSMASGGRTTISFNVPENGLDGEVPDKWEPIPFGKLNQVKEGNDITLVSLGVGVHRSIEAAKILEEKGISTEVLDLRCVVPLDIEALKNSVEKTKALLIIDEDYKRFGLSGEICATLLENEMSFKFGRVCTETTIPYSRELEDQVLPNTKRIVKEAQKILKK
ncbi:MAG: transketolase C-terminal domain-containing protein, partial [Candidatus Thorarchaeota archaeon]